MSVTNKTWHSLLKDTTVENGVDVLINLDYQDNPHPVVAIDEFGFDYGGETDQKSAKILEETKRREPNLTLTVYQMRGPVAKVLATTYRKVVDLVMMEGYVRGKNEYWSLMAQVEAARMNGLIEKSIILLGPTEWAQTREELEQQIRFVRLIAPESPGIGFFAPPNHVKKASGIFGLCR